VKLLLDSMMSEKLGTFLRGHEVTHVVDLDWQQPSNGKLLTAAESEGFDVLLTKDAKMPYQQNMVGRNICLVILKPESQDFNDLVALSPQVLRLLPTLKPGSVTRVTAD
jgi:predicted nuclease of predicted toxin-antitoxin system